MSRARTAGRGALLGVIALVLTFLLPSAARAETVPGPPTNVTATAGRLSAIVSWTAPPADPDSSPVTSYVVTADPGAATCSTTSETSCLVPGLDAGTEYTFTVVASNDTGPGQASEASAPATPTPATVPDAPTNLVASADVGTVMVSWTAPMDDGGSPILGYTVTSEPDGLTCGPTLDLSCTVTGLTAGTPYTFTAAATNAVGSAVSDPSSEVSPTPLPPDLPEAPTNVQAVLVGQTANVTWTAGADGGSPINDYLMSTNNRPAGSVGSGTSVFVSGLRYGREYRFVLTAVTAAGTGSASIASAPVTPRLVTALRITTATRAYRYGGRAARVVGQWSRTDNGHGVSARRVELVSRAAGSVAGFTHLAFARSSAAGLVAFAGLRPSRNAVLRLVAPTGGAFDGATSTARAMTAIPQIGASLSHRSVRVGRAVTLAGRVTPALATRRVELQQHRGRRWVRLMVSTLTSRSRYSFTVRRPLTGRYVLRTVVLASRLSGAAVSRPTVLRVTPARSVTHITLDPPRIRIGRSAQIFGDVSPAAPRHLVYLQARAGRSWHTVGRQRLDRWSTYVFSVQPGIGRHVYRVYDPAVRRRVAASISRAVALTVLAPKRRKPAPPPPSGAGCTPGYSPCIAPGPDVDCAGGSGDGPRYVQGPVRVTGSDPYGLDRDGDGIACES